MSNFIRTPRWVFAHPELRHGDAVTYATLAYFADNKERVCSPTVAEITALARVKDKKTVFRSLKRLEETGCIEVRRRKGFANVYHLPADPPKAGAID